MDLLLSIGRVCTSSAAKPFRTYQLSFTNFVFLSAKLDKALIYSTLGGGPVLNPSSYTGRMMGAMKSKLLRKPSEKSDEMEVKWKETELMDKQ